LEELLDTETLKDLETENSISIQARALQWTSRAFRRRGTGADRYQFPVSSVPDRPVVPFKISKVEVLWRV